jgi:zinc transport system substrate-binding protein
MRWLALMILLAGAVGCDSRESGGGSKPVAAGAPARLQVLAAAYPLAEMAQKVGGEFVSVEWLCEGAQRPEEVESTADLRRRASRAGLVITAGAWDRWAVAELSEEARALRVIAPDHMAAARNAPGGAYLWLDPAVMRELTEAVRERLTVLDPSHEAAYRANAAAYRAEIDSVDRDFAAAVGRGAAGRRIVAVRAVWGAMTARYGVATVAPMDGVTEEKLSSADFRELARLARDAGRDRVFVSAWTPAAVRLRVEGQTKLRALSLDATGTSAPDGRSTWPRVMRFNLAELREGLK